MPRRRKGRRQAQGLAKLPNELLLVIAESTNSEQDINALARTNRPFFATLDTLLYRHNALHSCSSALLWAATLGLPVVAKKSLAAGANPSDAPATRWRARPLPLDRAAENGHTEIVDILLRTGRVDLNRKDRDGRAALALAAGYGYAEIVHMLLHHDGVDVDQKDKGGQTALALAAYYGHAGIVDMLLRSGRIDVEQRDREGRTALALAVDGNHADVLTLLLEYGADPDASYEYGYTPLDHACNSMRGTTVLKLLLDTGRVNVDHQSGNGNTPLMCAAATGNVEAVRLLLLQGCDVSLRDDHGRTALWDAAYCHKSLAVAQLLLDWGCDEVDLKDRDGLTPIDIALAEGNDDFIKLLQPDEYWDGFIDYTATTGRK